MRTTAVLLSIAILLCIPLIPVMLVEVASVLPASVVVVPCVSVVACGNQPLALLTVVASRAPPAAPALA